MYLPKVFQYSTKIKRALLKPLCVVFFYRRSELDVPIVDDVYYEFTNHQEDLKFLEYYHKDIGPKISEHSLQHIFHGKKEVWQKSLDKQVEPNLDISEYENQRGKISKEVF